MGLRDIRSLARAATAIENGDPDEIAYVREHSGPGLTVGITGPPGAGKSSLVDAMARELRGRGKTIAIVAVDPTSRATGGALLGDRIRMQRHHGDPGIFIRSMATRGAAGGIAQATVNVARLFRAAGYDYILIETVGVGQDEIAIARLADVTVVVLVPGMGDDVQAIKAGIMEIADVFAINKADHAGAEQTEREIHAMLSLDGRAKPIVKTVATEQIGVADLLQAIDSCPRRVETVDTTFEIDHLGVAVRSVEEALAFYESRLGMTVAARETVAAEKVNVAMLPAAGSRIELLEATGAESAIARFIEKRGEGLHHVALKVPDLAATIARLQAGGARIIGEPRKGAGGHLYVFVHPASTGGVLLELIQK
jgi:LAO/AO transport system kinase